MRKQDVDDGGSHRTNDVNGALEVYVYCKN